VREITAVMGLVAQQATENPASVQAVILFTLAFGVPTAIAAAARAATTPEPPQPTVIDRTPPRLSFAESVGDDDPGEHRSGGQLRLPQVTDHRARTTQPVVPMTLSSVSKSIGSTFSS
jgi:hypothetical protein